MTSILLSVLMPAQSVRILLLRQCTKTAERDSLLGKAGDLQMALSCERTRRTLLNMTPQTDQTTQRYTWSESLSIILSYKLN